MKKKKQFTKKPNNIFILMKIKHVIQKVSEWLELEETCIKIQLNKILFQKNDYYQEWDKTED